MGHVNKVSHVFTLSHVAEMLGKDEDWLFEVAEEMDTEDGQLWVGGVGEDGVMAFTDDGIENLKELIAIHKDTPKHHRKTPPSAHCDHEAEDRRVQRNLTANRIDQRACGLQRMVTRVRQQASRRAYDQSTQGPHRNRAYPHRLNPAKRRYACIRQPRTSPS
jgi:hypothetical protein